MMIGYARVSTKQQSLNRQVDQLKKEGVKVLFEEKITGKQKERPELKKMLEYAREGDVIVVTSISRLARSTKDLISIIEDMQHRKIDLISIKENWLDTTTPQGKFLFTVFAGLSEFERELISERTKDGLKSARARGRIGGRPKAKKGDIERAFLLYDMDTLPIRDICQMAGISKATLYNYLKKRKEGEI